MDIIEIINKILENLYIKTFLIILTGIYAGYTLQPVPKWLNELFDTNLIFKFIIILIIGITMLHPLDMSKLMVVIVCAVLILGLFEGFRNIMNN